MAMSDYKYYLMLLKFDLLAMERDERLTAEDRQHILHLLENVLPTYMKETLLLG